MERIEEESGALRDSMESQGRQIFDKIEEVGNTV
jgi:hypothetical protein